MVAGTAVQKFMMTLAKEQEILMNIADMAIDTYVAESTLLRVKKMVSIKGEEACKDQIDMLQVYMYDALDRLSINGKTAINSMVEGDEQRMMLLGLKRFCKATPINTKEARRRIAKTLCEAGKYCY
jgi:hypothetical protein